MPRKHDTRGPWKFKVNRGCDVHVSRHGHMDVYGCAGLALARAGYKRLADVLQTHLLRPAMLSHFDPAEAAVVVAALEASDGEGTVPDGTPEAFAAVLTAAMTYTMRARVWYQAQLALGASLTPHQQLLAEGGGAWIVPVSNYIAAAIEGAVVKRGN